MIGLLIQENYPPCTAHFIVQLSKKEVPGPKNCTSLNNVFNVFYCFNSVNFSNSGTSCGRKFILEVDLTQNNMLYIYVSILRKVD